MGIHGDISVPALDVRDHDGTCHSHDPHGVTQTDKLKPADNGVARHEVLPVWVSASLEARPVPVNTGLKNRTWAESGDETDVHRAIARAKRLRHQTGQCVPSLPGLLRPLATIDRGGS